MKLKTLLNKYLIFSLICLTSFGCSNLNISNLDVQKLNQKAAELMASGDIDGAIGRLESIQDLNPNFFQTNYNLGIAYKHKKEYDKSIKYLERSIKIKPNFPEAYLTIAIINEELADNLFKEEIKRLEKENPDQENSFDDIELDVSKKERVIVYLTNSIKAYEEYIKYSTDPNIKIDVESKIKELEDTLTKYEIKGTK